MRTIKPKRLQFGDTIGIISPSQCPYLMPEHKEGFETGIKRLEKLGFKIKLAKNVLEKFYYSAGTPQQRAADLHDMFLDPDVKAIVMTIGGDTANEVLPLLDFKLIKKHSKILMGMSDGATLLCPITDRTGLVTFYGPDLIYSFGLQGGDREFERQLLGCLMEGRAEFKSLANLTTDEGVKMPNEWYGIRDGKANGRLVGGYLEITLDLIATNYLRNLDGAILYLESMEASSIIHMRFQYLKMLGVFNKIAGLILGYFPDIKKDKKFYRPIGDIVLELTEDKDFPILQVNELGHMVKNYTWPNGIKVELNSSNKTITVLENCIS